MKNLEKRKPVSTHQETITEIIKTRLIQMFSILLFIFGLVIWLCLFLFDLGDYGNPYASTAIEDYYSILIFGSWINGALKYWFGLFAWCIPILFFAWGYKLLNKESLFWALPKIFLFFLSAILICAGLKNIGFNGGNISLLLDGAINNTTITFANDKSLNMNYIAIALGAIFFSISISIKINVYFNFLFSVLGFLKKLLTYLLMTFKPILFFVLNNKENKENERDRYNKKNISSIRRLSKGMREEKERQGEFRLDTNDSSTFFLPSIDLLNDTQPNRTINNNEDNLENTARMLENVLDDFGIRGEIGRVQAGPVVTRYELEPAPGLRSSRVIGLSDDIARSMSAISTRVAVVAGRNAIGIELPNEDRETVYLRELISSKTFEKNYELPLVLGRDISGNPVVTDLGKMPHLLIAGTTGSGKSVAVNAMILSLLYKLTPKNLRFIMIDPKMLELYVYENIPHLLHPVVTEPRKAIIALKWAVKEMNDRYRLMSQLGVRNINSYNEQITKAKNKGQMLTKTLHTGFDPDTGKPMIEKHEIAAETLPNIVVVIDEMADLMLSSGREIEMSIQSLAQKARAAGIHLIVATQRPSVDVITGTIKANLPTRISFQVTSKIDSRTILGEQGAEQLLGKGDMLFMESASQVQRVHGPFVSDTEVEKVANFLRSSGAPEYLFEITAEPEEIITETEDNKDPLFSQAVELISREKKVSTSFLQRHLQIGYNRAARIIDKLENEQIISPANHAGKREIFIDKI